MPGPRATSWRRQGELTLAEVAARLNKHRNTVAIYVRRGDQRREGTLPADERDKPYLTARRRGRGRYVAERELARVLERWPELASEAT